MNIDLILVIFLVIGGSAAAVYIFNYSRKQKLALHKLASDLGRENLKSGTIYEGQLNGYKYYYEYSSGSKNRPSYFKVWLDCPSPGGFTLGREGWLDRICKRLGICAEIQTGDFAFDREFYVRTDSVAFTRTYLAAPEVREAVKAISVRGFPEIVHDGSVLKAGVSPFQPAKDAGSVEIEPVVRELMQLAKGVPPESYEPRIIGVPAWKIRRNFVYTFSILLMLAGMGLFFWGYYQYPPLHGRDIFMYIVGYVIAACLFFIALSVVLLKGRSSSHTDLLTNTLFALIGFPLFGFGGAVVLNGFLDASAVVYHDARVTGRHYTSSRGSRTYYLKVKSWNGLAEGENIRVDSSMYHKVRVGDTVLTVGTRAGYLGFEWLESYGVKK
jgi:hypothetical protein